METTRQNKIARLLQKELSDVFLTETRKMPGVMVSVSAVRVSSDLSIAKAYLSIFPGAKSQEMLDSIRQNAKTIRYEMAKRVRFQLRKMPELSFFLDDSLDYAQRIDEILKANPVTTPADDTGEEA